MDKKRYTKPSIEIELYSLDTSIASHCGITVSNGPAIGKHEQCDDYDDPFAISTYNVQSDEPTYNVWFYEDTNCDCYYSAADSGYWTS